MAAKKYCGPAYQPHVTRKRHKEFVPGETFLLDRLYVVEAPNMDPRIRVKKVVAVLALQGRGGETTFTS